MGKIVCNLNVANFEFCIFKSIARSCFSKVTLDGKFPARIPAKFITIDLAKSYLWITLEEKMH